MNVLQKKIVRREYISHEEYSKLIRDYKSYDLRQKNIINKAFQDINKLSKTVQKLEEKITKYKELLGTSPADSIRKKLDLYEDMKKDRNYYKRAALKAEEALLAIQYPEYDWSGLTIEKRKAILDILSK